MIQYSTDYDFGDIRTAPYSKVDTRFPIKVYGESGLAGWQAIPASSCTHLFSSITGVRGKDENTSIKAILHLAAEQGPSGMFNDRLHLPATLIPTVTADATSATADDAYRPDKTIECDRTPTLFYLERSARMELATDQSILRVTLIASDPAATKQPINPRLISANQDNNSHPACFIESLIFYHQGRSSRNSKTI